MQDKIDLFGFFDETPNKVEDSPEPADATNQDEIIDNDELKDPEPTPADPVKKDDESAEVVSDIESVIQNLYTKGVLKADEDAEYDMTEEGLAELITQTAEKSKETAINEFVSSTKDPEVTKALLDHLKNGGTLQDFQPEVDFDFGSVVFMNDEGEPIEDNMVYMIEDYLKAEGESDEDIQDEIEAHKKAGTLLKYAESCQKKMVKLQAKVKEEKAKAAEIAEENNRKRLELEQEKFKLKVTSKTELAGFKLTKDEAEKLYDFITKTDKKGNTEFSKATTEEHQLAFAYMVMKNFNLDTVKKEIATEQTRTLKKKLKVINDPAAAGKRGSDLPTQKQDVGIGNLWNIV